MASEDTATLCAHTIIIKQKLEKRRKSKASGKKKRKIGGKNSG
jgi:hypothetical protein